MADELTRKQQEAVQQLRDIDAQIGHLSRRRAAIRQEMEHLYPATRVEALTRPAPREAGVTLSVFNYRREGFTGRVTTSPLGVKALEALNSDKPIQRTPLDYAMISLCKRETGADIEKLLAVEVLQDFPNLRSALHKLVRDGYLNATFTVVGVTSNA